MSDVVTAMVRKNIKRDQTSERNVEALSRSLWPWLESWLLTLVSLLAVLDYISTYAVLEFSGKTVCLRGRSACQLGPADERVYKLVLGRHGCW